MDECKPLLAGVIAVTALSGAYVAGMDAGRAYNTYPLMDGQLVPAEYWAQWQAGAYTRPLLSST